MWVPGTSTRIGLRGPVRSAVGGQEPAGPVTVGGTDEHGRAVRAQHGQAVDDVGTGRLGGRVRGPATAGRHRDYPVAGDPRGTSGEPLEGTAPGAAAAEGPTPPGVPAIGGAGDLTV